MIHRHYFDGMSPKGFRVHGTYLIASTKELAQRALEQQGYTELTFRFSSTQDVDRPRAYGLVAQEIKDGERS